MHFLVLLNCSVILNRLFIPMIHPEYISRLVISMESLRFHHVCCKIILPYPFSSDGFVFMNGSAFCLFFSLKVGHPGQMQQRKRKRRKKKKRQSINESLTNLFYLPWFHGGSLDPDRMVVKFTTTFAIRAYHH